MMKNRASLLALLVLVAATILMVFFVMPRISGDKKSVGDVINQAGDTVKNAVTENAKKTAEAPQNTPAATAAATDIGRQVRTLGSAATSSLANLRALFTTGKTPAQDTLAAAKTTTIGALQAVVDFAAPQNADAATAALIEKARAGAGKALAIVKVLPDNVTDATAAIDTAIAALTEQPQSQAQAGAQTPASGPIVPSFDVLRVEPDGSTVIAGSAEPNSKLQVMDGDKVVTSIDVGPNGDFAAVLDDPLPPGDHELVLRATKDGKAVDSQEVATVSVPKDDKSQLLAMVSKPGAASRIITAPSAKQNRVATAGDQSAADTTAKAGVTSPDTAPAPDTATPQGAKMASKDPAAGNTAPAGSSSADQPEVMINAVEIENDHLFIAGSTRPNAKVRAYADDKLVGNGAAGTDGHFVIDGKMPLTVGDHQISVDMLDASGKVAVRASVNFNRPKGNQVTVAAQTKPVEGANSGDNSAAMVPLDQSELGKLRDDAGKAFALLQSLFAGGKQPNAEQLAAARSGTEIALKSLSEFRPGINASADLKQTAADASAAAAGALASLSALPKDPKSIQDALPSLGQMIAALTKPENANPRPANVETSSSDSGPKTIQQAPLSKAEGAVIIRRGDTLWQISRRTYGAGVRYTTIYLANEDKISNPDRILPGQVFGLPKDALPNAEELHRKRMSGEHL